MHAPRSRQSSHGCLRCDLAGLIVDQAHRHRNTVTVGLRIEDTAVGRIRPHWDSPPAVVLNSGRCRFARRHHVQLDAARLSSAWACRLVQRYVHLRIAPRHHRPVRQRAPFAAYCAIAHQLAVDPAVVRVVDLFGHQPVQHLADFGRGVVHINRECGLLRGQPYRQHKRNKNCEREMSFLHSYAILISSRQA